MGNNRVSWRDKYIDLLRRMMSLVQIPKGRLRVQGPVVPIPGVIQQRINLYLRARLQKEIEPARPCKGSPGFS